MMLVPVTGVGTSTDDQPSETVDMIVGFHEGIHQMSEDDSYQGAEIVEVDRPLDFIVARTDEPDRFREDAKEDDRVEYVERDATKQWFTYTPNDPRFGEQYGPKQVDGPDAWDETLGDHDKSVCIVDSGVRYTHQDLEENWAGGTDIVNGDSDPWDDNGHGTHVSGIAAGTIDDGDGIAGMGNTKLYGVKVVDQDGRGTFSDVAQGVRWCADNGGDVISISLGCDCGRSDTLHNAMEYAWDKGSLIVAAAGNDGCDGCINYPARDSYAMAITCTNSSEGICYFSSTGKAAELAAPGRSILSTYNSGDSSYKELSGTSMSAPHASGVAALVWSWVPSVDNSELRSLLQDTARDKGADGWDRSYGHGIVDAGDAIAQANPPPVADAGPDIEVHDDGDGHETVTLDGSASEDPNGEIVEHVWYQGSDRLGTGEKLTLELDNGTYSFTLEVTDDKGESAQDRVNVTIHNVPPVADAGADQTLADDDGDGQETASLDATGSSDPDGSISEYAWHEDGTLLATGATPDVSLAVGTHEIVLTVEDDGGVTATDTVVVEVAPNQAPEPEAGPDVHKEDSDGDGQEDVTLDGTNSSDPDGTLESYTWSTNGTTLATGATATLTFDKGQYEVVLEVTDNGGKTASDNLVVSVLNSEPPVADAGPDRQAKDSDGDGTETVTLDGTASYDPDGQVESYDWYIGDDLIATGEQPTVTLPVGTHEVELLVTDDNGTWDLAETIADIQPNDIPDADAGPDQVLRDGDGDGEEPVDLDGTDSVDPDGTIEGYAWYDDGTLIADGATPTVTLPVGEHPIALEVTDNAGDTGSDTVNITVEANQPPTAIPVADCEADRCSFYGANSTDLEGEVTSYTWTLGDGETATGETVHHRYEKGGDHTVCLTVEDEGSATDETCLTVSTQATLLRETFDDGHPGAIELDGLWHVASRCAVPTTLPYYLGYHQQDACSYDDPADLDGSATFTADLTTANASSLRFDHRWQTEASSANVDVMMVQARPDGEQRWETLAAWDSADPNQPDWQLEALDLTSLVGDTVDIRFLFDAVDRLSNDHPGWHIDDVRLMADSNAENRPPTAEMDVSCQGRTCTFEATASHDLDGQVGAYRWAFGDGTTATGETVEHTYAQHGTYEVSLTTEDDRGATDTTWERFYVAPTLVPGPLAPIDAFDRTPEEGTTYTFTTGPDGFEKENEQRMSEVAWNPGQGRLSLLMDRTDPGDEIRARELPQPLTPDGPSFEVSASWASTQEGHWQFAFPLFLGPTGARDVAQDASVVSIHYWSRGSGDASKYVMKFRDAQGEVQLIDTAFLKEFQTYRFSIAYDAPTRELSLTIEDSQGTELASTNTTLGDDDNDAFLFQKVGIATDGRVGSREPVARGWVDDVTVFVDDGS